MESQRRQERQSGEKNDAKGEDRDATDVEVPIPEQPWAHERVASRQGMNQEQIEGDSAKRRLDADLRGAEPVLQLPAIQHDLQCTDSEAQRREAEKIERRMPCRRLTHGTQESEHGQDAKRHIDEKDPPPAVVFRKPAAEHGADGRTDDHSQHPDRHCPPLAFGRIDVQEHGLRKRNNTICPKDCATPHSAELTVKSTTDSTNTFLRP